MCVFISWGLVTTSRFRNNGPRADILHMDRCGGKTLHPVFLSSSISLSVLLYLLISQCLVYSHLLTVLYCTSSSLVSLILCFSASLWSLISCLLFSQITAFYYWSPRTVLLVCFWILNTSLVEERRQRGWTDEGNVIVRSPGVIVKSDRCVGCKLILSPL